MPCTLQQRVKLEDRPKDEYNDFGNLENSTIAFVVISLWPILLARLVAENAGDIEEFLKFLSVFSVYLYMCMCESVGVGARARKKHRVHPECVCTNMRNKYATSRTVFAEEYGKTADKKQGKNSRTIIT